MKSSEKKPFLAWLIFTVVLVSATFLTSYFPLWANVPINVILPIIVLFAFKMVMFERLKLSTLVIMRALILLVLFNVLDGQIFTKIVLAFFVINILEATMTDLLKNKQPYNFVSGLVLTLSVFTLWGSWIPNVTGKWSGIYSTNVGPMSGIFESNEVFIFGTICWVLAYTLWNWIFVIGEFGPSVALLHVGILLTPLLGSLITLNPGFWLVFRANSLTTGGVFQISQKQFVEKTFKSNFIVSVCKKVQTKKMQIILMIVNLILIGIPTVMFFLKKGF